MKSKAALYTHMQVFPCDFKHACKDLLPFQHKSIVEMGNGCWAIRPGLQSSVVVHPIGVGLGRSRRFNNIIKCWKTKNFLLLELRSFAQTMIDIPKLKLHKHRLTYVFNFQPYGVEDM